MYLISNVIIIIKSLLTNNWKMTYNEFNCYKIITLLWKKHNSRIIIKFARRLITLNWHSNTYLWYDWHLNVFYLVSRINLHSGLSIFACHLISVFNSKQSQFQTSKNIWRQCISNTILLSNFFIIYSWF